MIFIRTTLVLILISVLVLSCSNTKDKSPFDSFVGVWKTTMSDGIYHETWTKISSTKFHGNSYLVQGRDTSMREYFELKKDNSIWALNILFEDQDPVVFKASEFGEGNFKAFNPENDFPQIISYQKTNEGISAFITNGEVDTMFFEFTPSK